MIFAFLILTLLHPLPYLQKGFETLDPEAWEACLHPNRKVQVSLSILELNDAELGRDQVLLMLRKLKDAGKTESFTVEEFNVGNPPKGIVFFYGTWEFRKVDGELTRHACFFTFQQHESGWYLSEMYCKEGP